MVEARALLRVGVAADELEARRAHRDRERERVAAVLGADVRPRVDGQLVGERRERRQHARAAHGDVALGLAHLVQRDLAGGLLGLGLGAVDLRVHDRVGGREVAVAHQRLVGHDVRRALLVAAPRPHVGAPGEAGEGDVQVVGRAPHRAAGEGRDELDRAPPPLEVRARARDQVGDVHGRAVGGRRREHLGGVLVLQVVDAGERHGRAAQLVVVERMRDLDPVQPQLAGVAAQAVQELLAGAGAHTASPAATARSASSSGIARATCSVFADTAELLARPAQVDVPVHHAVLEPAEAGHLDGDRVAGLHRPRVGRRAGEDDVAGLERDQPAQVGQQIGDRPDQVGGRALLDDRAVQERAEVEVGRVEVGRRGERGADRAEAVLALHPQHRAAVGVAEVVQADVVCGGVAGHVAERLGLGHAVHPPPDDRGHLALVVQEARAARAPQHAAVPVQRRRRLHEVRRLGGHPGARTPRPGCDR